MHVVRALCLRFRSSGAGVLKQIRTDLVLEFKFFVWNNMRAVSGLRRALRGEDIGQRVLSRNKVPNVPLGVNSLLERLTRHGKPSWADTHPTT